MTTTPEKIVYTATASTIGGRRGGHATTSDGAIDVELNAPKEMGGPGTGTNPEQLFATGYSACFNSAFLRVAKEAGLTADGTRVTVKIGLGPVADGGFGLTADLEVAAPGIERSRAQELAERTHQVCPYSNAIRGNVPTTVTAVEA